MLARRIRHQSGLIPVRKEIVERRPQRLPESVTFPSPRPACEFLLSTLSLSADLFAFGESGREDSNLRPPEPRGLSAKRADKGVRSGGIKIELKYACSSLLFLFHSAFLCAAGTHGRMKSKLI
jgi:hypothetical protein